MELSLSRTLHALVGTLDRLADRILRAEFGVSYTTFLTLYAVSEVGGGTQREVAAWLGTTEPPVSRSLRALAQEGFVEILAAPAGGHRRHVDLTPRGRTLVATGGEYLESKLSAMLSQSGVPYTEYSSMSARLLSSLGDAQNASPR
jgi:DNA-binding MarR family transcriptional regulator